MLPIIVNPFGLLICSCINPCCIPAYPIYLLVLSPIFFIVFLLSVLALFAVICLFSFGSSLAIVFTAFGSCLVVPALLLYVVLIVFSFLFVIISYIPSMPLLSSLLNVLECTRDLPTVFSKATCGLVNIFEPIYTVEGWFKTFFRNVDKNISKLISYLSGKTLDHCIPAQCFDLSIRSCISCSPYNLICKGAGFLSG